jgi:two-component system response regulator NreC|tara:strand:+ start:24 stop:683 length:660 start_codon:yes stop_codon:yes gene_type:complete
MNRIAVFLADDQPIVRQGVALLLQEQMDIEVVGEASDGLETLESVQISNPDVVLMDISMPGTSGLEATRRLTKSIPGLAVLILTVHERGDFLFQALQAGALGYLLKTATVAELIGAIRTVYAGEVFIYPRMATKLVGDYLMRVQSGHTADTYTQLSLREREVLPLLAESHSNREIAGQLHLSPYTVQTYRQRIMRKLDLHNRTELLRYALRKELISLDP